MSTITVNALTQDADTLGHNYISVGGTDYNFYYHINCTFDLSPYVASCISAIKLVISATSKSAGPTAVQFAIHGDNVFFQVSSASTATTYYEYNCYSALEKTMTCFNSINLQATAYSGTPTAYLSGVVVTLVLEYDETAAVDWENKTLINQMTVSCYSYTLAAPQGSLDTGNTMIKNAYSTNTGYFLVLTPPMNFIKSDIRNVRFIVYASSIPHYDASTIVNMTSFTEQSEISLSAPLTNGGVLHFYSDSGTDFFVSNGLKLIASYNPLPEPNSLYLQYYPNKYTLEFEYKKGAQSYVRVGNEWKLGETFIHNGTSWVSARPKIYNGTEWK